MTAVGLTWGAEDGAFRGTEPPPPQPRVLVPALRAGAGVPRYLPPSQVVFLGQKFRFSQSLCLSHHEKSHPAPCSVIPSSIPEDPKDARLPDPALFLPPTLLDLTGI